MPEPDIGGGMNMGPGQTAGTGPYTAAPQTTAVLGTNDLQKAIDGFSATVTKLSTLYNQMSKDAKSGNGIFGNKSGGSGSPTLVSAQQTKSPTGFSSQINQAFSFMRGTAGAVYGKDVMGAPKTPGFNPNTHANGGNGQGFAGQASFSGSQTAPTGPGGGPGGPGGPNSPSSPGGPSGPGGGSSTGWAGSVRAGGFMSVVNSIASFGSQNMSTQNNINGFTRQMGLFGVSNYAARYNSIGANGQNENALAQNSGDAVAGAASVFSVGNYAPGSQRFNAAQGMTNAIGVTNPGLGYAASAQAMQQMYSPQTSMQMLRMGYSATPLKIGGGTSNAGQLAGGIMNRIFPQLGGKVNSTQFGISFGANGKGTMDLNEAGLDPSVMTPFLKSYSNYMNTKGATQAGFNKDVNAIAHGNQSLGTKLGLSSSNIIAAQGAQSASTSMQGDISQSFTQGLTDATSSLATFRNLLDKIVAAPGINQAVGGSAGALGGLHDLSNPKNMLEGIGGMAMLSGIASKFGGGGLMSTSAAIAAGATPVVQVGGGTGISASGATGMKGLIAGEGGAMGLATTMAPVLVAMIGLPLLQSFLGTEHTHHEQGTPKGTTQNTNIWDNGPSQSWNPASKNPSDQGFSTWAGTGRAIENFLTGGPKSPLSGAVNAVNKDVGAVSKWLGFAGGGTVPGYAPGRDTVHAMLSPGEGVLVPEAVKGMGGEKAVNAINKRYAGYRGGGKKSDKGAGKRGMRHFATGGVTTNTAQTMLNYMNSKIGDAYSETNRFGDPPYDCSSLVYAAANAAGMKMPESDSLANTEAGWFAGKGASQVKSAGAVKGGDILFFTGASPGPSSYGPIGHVGMAENSTTYVSAYDTQSGVCKNPISGDGFVVGMRLGGAASGSSGGSNGSSGSSSTSSTGGGGGGGGNSAPSNTSETANIAAGLGGSAGGGWSGGKSGSTGSNANTPAGTTGTTGTSTGTPGNVQSYKADVDAMLKQAGLAASLDTNVLKQMTSESNGNPDAINKTDINWQNGTPSVGLMQVIKPTFDTYAGPYKNTNPQQYGVSEDPDANIYAALMYAKSRYGSTLMSGGQGIGSGQGYAVGGVVPETNFATGGVVPNFTHAFDCPPTKAGGSGGGNTVHLEFKQGSITIGGSGSSSKPPYQGNTGTKYDPSDSARELIAEIKKQLESEDLYASIQKGNH